MKITPAFALLSALSILSAAEAPKPVDLKDADKIRVLKIQLEQHKHLADREKARAEYEASQRALDQANQSMVVLQDELRGQYFCSGCDLSNDLKLNPPLPKEVTVVKNN